MKAVSTTIKLQTLKLPQLPLGLPQLLEQQGLDQIQSLFSGLGYLNLATFGEIERED